MAQKGPKEGFSLGELLSWHVCGLREEAGNIGRRAAQEAAGAGAGSQCAGGLLLQAR